MISPFYPTVSPTKEKIYYEAIRMFAERGYDDVSTRDIAAVVGIKGASVYAHFESKKEILLDLYKTYSYHRRKVIPDMDMLLLLAERLPPLEVLLLADYHFDPSIEEMLNRIVYIGLHRMEYDAESKAFVKENVIDASTAQIVPLVNRLVELGRIEPLDVGAFANIVLHYCFSAVAFNATSMRVDREAWRRGITYLFELAIRPTGK